MILRLLRKTRYHEIVLIEMSPQYITYQEPDLIIFKGTISELPATIIQNVNQVNFLLYGVPKALPQEPARRAKIGFDLEA